jgi:hypothetical protein
MSDIKTSMIEEDIDLPTTEQLFIDRQSAAFDAWKDRAKENGTYFNPLIKRSKPNEHS